MTNATPDRPAETGHARRRAFWLGAACVVACGLFALGAWVLGVALFGSPEQLHCLSPSDRTMLADHDRQIEDMRELVLGRRQPPATAAENHAEALEVQRLVFHRAREEPARADSALYLLGLEAKRPLVAQLQQEKVDRAREHDRIIGVGLVGSAFALVGWAIRRWRQAGRATGEPDHLAAQPEPAEGCLPS